MGSFGFDKSLLVSCIDGLGRFVEDESGNNVYRRDADTLGAHQLRPQRRTSINGASCVFYFTLIACCRGPVCSRLPSPACCIGHVQSSRARSAIHACC